jgi:phosphatidylglycerophosphatase A
LKEHLAKLIATGLYSGFGRPFPGTWGTIPAWLIGYFLIKDNLPVLMAATLVTFGLSVWSAGVAEKFYGHDARKIVIDEWAGMLLTFWLIPLSLTNYAIAFFAFRFFDVVKIPPATQCERLPGGWGITMDDMVAGAQACLVTHGIIWGLAQLGFA